MGSDPNHGEAVKEGEKYGVDSTPLLAKIRVTGTRPILDEDSFFHSMGVLDIIREAGALFQTHSPAMLSILALLLCPLSVFILLRTPLLGGTQIVRRFSHNIEDVAIVAGLLRTPSLTLIYTKLSETLICYTMCLPVFATLWLSAKVAILYTAASTYEAKRISLYKFAFVAPALWRRITATSIWVILIVLGFSSALVLLLLLFVGLLDVLQLPEELALVPELALGVFYSLVFAHMMVICNLATVVSVVENYSGGAALVRSLCLIKGRTQIALLLYLLTGLGAALVEGLFHYRVLGLPRNKAVDVGYTIPNWLWEGPLLVFMYSFLYLFDAIMSYVFYYTCKSAQSEQCENSCILERISFGLDMGTIV